MMIYFVESEATPSDGRSLKDVLLDGKTQFKDRNLFFYFNDLLTAMRVGKYKVIFAILCKLTSDIFPDSFLFTKNQLSVDSDKL